ncbi:hypothetical protein IWZ03DRAFT_390920 [Phyllosticta citriasiana]|uniref:Secreted protein n=1 Tax=Phyllosticta citriasiana TaxID=595635 RepID=A0ABR1K7M4_9PEZI
MFALIFLFPLSRTRQETSDVVTPFPRFPCTLYPCHKIEKIDGRSGIGRYLAFRPCIKTKSTKTWAWSGVLDLFLRFLRLHLPFVSLPTCPLLSTLISKRQSSLQKQQKYGHGQYLGPGFFDSTYPL